MNDLSLYDANLNDLGADDDAFTGNWPAALASAAYGYTRGGHFSPFTAAIYGFFGYSYPLVSTLLFAIDAVFIQETPAKRFAAERIRDAAERRRLKVAAAEKRLRAA